MRSLGTGTLRLEISDEITEELADAVSRYMTDHPTHDVEMEVDTPGGDWWASRTIFYSLKNHGRRVTARIRKAASGGALIVMAADVRHLHPAGYFFLHRPSGDLAKAELDAIADAKAALIASRCRVPAGRIRRWMDEVTTIRAQRALEYGLVHDVPGLPKPRHVTVFL